MLWSALCLLLFAGGLAPSRVLLPVPRELYYALQAVAMPAIVALQLCLASAVLRRLGDAEPRTNAARALTLSALCFLVPDLVTFVFVGADAMKLVVRAAGPLALVVGWFYFARGIPGSPARRSGGALLALVAQGLVAAVLVR